MDTTTSIPIAIKPEAVARVAELGMKQELDCMLEHSRRAIPGLLSLEVQLALPYDTGDETSIVIEAMIEERELRDDSTQWDWLEWQAETFPGEVCRFFVLTFLERTDDSYDLGFLRAFANSKEAQRAIQAASTALAVLDQIDNDPVKRAAAIASIGP